MTIAVGCSHVSGLLVPPFFTTAGPDVVREVGPDHLHGLDTRDPNEGSPASTTDRSTSCHQHLRKPVTPYGVFLSLWCRNRVPRCGDHPIAKPLLSGSHARLRSILGGAMAGLVDAAVDHDGPGDPRGLVGDRDRRLLGRHAAEQLRDPRMFVRASLRLAHNGHCAINK